MKYITGLYALNLPCKLDTCGDWHAGTLNWAQIPFAESEESMFGEYGIEPNHPIPEHEGTYYVANHLRACIDLLAQQDFSNAKGMKNDYICTDKYDEEFFDKIGNLKMVPYWEKIDRFMEKEYRMKWLRYKKARNW